MVDSFERPPQGAQQPMEAAHADLNGIKEQLEAASLGNATPTQVKASLQEYLDVHGPTIKAAAASVGEEVRRQALTELYKWRAQVTAQLATHAPTRAPADVEEEVTPASSETPTGGTANKD